MTSRNEDFDSTVLKEKTDENLPTNHVIFNHDQPFTQRNSNHMIDNITSSNGKQRLLENYYLDITPHNICDKVVTPTSFSDNTKSNAVLSKLKIIKNLLVICLSYLLLFTAYEALMNLQSTINATKSIGTYTLAVVYASFCLSCLILPSLIIDKLGCKWTLICSLFAYTPYIAANFFPKWIVFIPAAVLCGIAAGPLWAARCSYINQLSFQFATYVKDSHSVIASLFFGIGCMFYQSAQILGNLISYHVLKPANTSYEESTQVLKGCGANFCNSEGSGNISIMDLNTNLMPPTEDQRHILISIFLICSIASAFMVWIFLDELKSTTSSADTEHSTTMTLLFAAFKQLKRKEQLLLVPLTFHLGLSDGFLFSDFTKAYVGCAWRIYHVGYVMMAYGTISSLCSVISAILVKFFGRIPTFLLSGIINAVKYGFLLVWNPNPNYPLPFFLIAGAWGCADSIWWGQLNAFYGFLFKEHSDAAFSIFFFVNSCGFLVAYAYESIFCTNIKIYILIFMLITGIIGYLIIEYDIFKCTGNNESKKKGGMQIEISE